MSNINTKFKCWANPIQNKHKENCNEDSLLLLKLLSTICNLWKMWVFLLSLLWVVVQCLIFKPTAVLYRCVHFVPPGGQAGTWEASGLLPSVLVPGSMEKPGSTFPGILRKVIFLRLPVLYHHQTHAGQLSRLFSGALHPASVNKEQESKEPFLDICIQNWIQSAQMLATISSVPFLPPFC